MVVVEWTSKGQSEPALELHTSISTDELENLWNHWQAAKDKGAMISKITLKQAVALCDLIQKRVPRQIKEATAQTKPRTNRPSRPKSRLRRQSGL